MADELERLIAKPRVGHAVLVGFTAALARSELCAMILHPGNEFGAI